MIQIFQHLEIIILIITNIVAIFIESPTSSKRHHIDRLRRELDEAKKAIETRERETLQRNGRPYSSDERST